jgi:asparagine synthetase B (glutamine-hydrolysing)
MNSDTRVAPDGRIDLPWLIVRRRSDGQLDVQGSARAIIGHQIPREPSDRPGGVYVQWDWDGAALTVRNDRAGFGQLFYASLDGNQGIALSPHVEQLAQWAETTLDEGALTILIRLGFHLGLDTPFVAIRALPPNATLVWRPGHLHISGQPHLPEPQPVARDDAVDQFIELFRAAIRQRPPIAGSTVVPLTGGQDSRHILFELCHQQRPPELCVTVRPYANATYDDASVAAQIASRLGVPHERIDMRRSLVAEDFRKYRRIGPMSDEGGWTSAMLDRLVNFRCAYDGIAGDMLTSGYLAGIVYRQQLHEYVVDGNWAALADVVLNHFSASEPALQPLLAQASFRDLGRQYVRDRLIEQLASFRHAAHPLAMFVINNRTRREIAMMSWLLCAQVNPYYAPYTDEELFTFLASLPAGEFACGQWFHRATLERAYPQWADLPYYDKTSSRQPAVGRWQAAALVAELVSWSARNQPRRFGTVARWAAARLLRGGGPGSAPRRVVQHWLAIEQMLARYGSCTAF